MTDDSFDGTGSPGATSDLLNGEKSDPQVENLYHWIKKVVAMRDPRKILRYSYVDRDIDGTHIWIYGIRLPRTRKYDYFRPRDLIWQACLISTEHSVPIIYWYSGSKELKLLDLTNESHVKDVVARLRHAHFWITLLGWVPPLCRWYIAFADE